LPESQHAPPKLGKCSLSQPCRATNCALVTQLQLIQSVSFDDDQSSAPETAAVEPTLHSHISASSPLSDRLIPGRDPDAASAIVVFRLQKHQQSGECSCSSANAIAQLELPVRNRARELVRVGQRKRSSCTEDYE
jgi:hypothetical protein